MKIMEPVEIGYLAGLIDGEGYIETNRVRLNVTSVDLDILDRAQSMCEMGHINGPYMAQKSTKPFWSWDVTDGHELARLFCAITPLMSSRRRLKILEAAETLAVRSKPSQCLWCGERIETKMRKNTTKYCNSTCRVNEWRSRKAETGGMS